MPPISYMHRRARNPRRGARDGAEGGVERKEQSIRKELASLSYEEGQRQLSPRTPAGVSWGVGGVGRSPDEDPPGPGKEPEEQDPADLKALEYENQGTWWAGVGLEAYEEQKEKGRSPIAGAERAGQVVSNLAGGQAVRNGPRGIRTAMTTEAVDREIGAAGSPISGWENGEISSGELKIDEEAVEIFYNHQPDKDDVRQGGIGDCYLLAAMVGMANTGPGCSRLKTIVRPSGEGYTVDFAGLTTSSSGQVRAQKGTWVRVYVSPLSGGEGVNLRRRGPEAVPLNDEEQLEAIREYGGRPQNRGFFGGMSRFFRGILGLEERVHTVNMNRTTVVLWPWIIEKAYAALGGGYGTIGQGGSSIIPMLALMGTDSTAYYTEVSGRDGEIEDMNAEEAGMAFQAAEARITGGGVVTVGSRTRYDMQRRSNLKDTWRVMSADAWGITLDMEEGAWSWGSLGENLNPFIQVETADGALHSVDPRAISEEDKEIIIDAVQEGRFVEVHARVQWHNHGLQLVPNHAYTVIQAAAGGIQLHNPWGVFQPGRLIRPYEFADYFSHLYLSDKGGRSIVESPW